MHHFKKKCRLQTTTKNNNPTYEHCHNVQAGLTSEDFDNLTSTMARHGWPGRHDLILFVPAAMQKPEKNDLGRFYFYTEAAILFGCFYLPFSTIQPVNGLRP